jgi:hypothetical protein
VRLSELRVGMRVIWWWNNHRCAQAEQFWAKVVAVHGKTVTVEFRDPMSKKPKLLRRRVYPALLQTVDDWRRDGRPPVRNLIARKTGMFRWRRLRSDEPAWDRVKALYVQAAREGKGFVCSACGREGLVKPPRVRAAQSMGRLAFHTGWVVIRDEAGGVRVIGPACAGKREPAGPAAATDGGREPGFSEITDARRGRRC